MFKQRRFFLSGCGISAAEMHIEADQIKSADSNECIYDSGNPGHIAEYKCNQIKTKQTDQQPVDCTDDDDGESSAIQIFISHKLYPCLSFNLFAMPLLIFVEELFLYMDFIKILSFILTKQEH